MNERISVILPHRETRNNLVQTDHWVLESKQLCKGYVTSHLSLHIHRYLRKTLLTISREHAKMNRTDKSQYQCLLNIFILVRKSIGSC